MGVKYEQPGATLRYPGAEGDPPAHLRPAPDSPPSDLLFWDSWGTDPAERAVGELRPPPRETEAGRAYKLLLSSSLRVLLLGVLAFRHCSRLWRYDESKTNPNPREGYNWKKP